jgi:hypothetical protein
MYASIDYILFSFCTVKKFYIGHVQYSIEGSEIIGHIFNISLAKRTSAVLYKTGGVEHKFERGPLQEHLHEYIKFRVEDKKIITTNMQGELLSIYPFTSIIRDIHGRFNRGLAKI